MTKFRNLTQKNTVNGIQVLLEFHHFTFILTLIIDHLQTQHHHGYGSLTKQISRYLRIIFRNKK